MGSDAQKQHMSIRLRRGAEGCVFRIDSAFLKDHQVVGKNTGGLMDGVFRGNGAVGGDVKQQFVIIGILFVTC